MTNRRSFCLKSVFSVFISLLLIISSCLLPGLADSREETDPGIRAEYLETFNNAVNAIKFSNPGMTVTVKAGISPTDGIAIVGKSSSELSPEATKYLSVIVDALFNPSKGLFRNLFNAIVGIKEPDTTLKLTKSVPKTDTVSVKGKHYVSALTPEDNFTLYTDRTGNRLKPEAQRTFIQLAFDDATLEYAKENAIGRLFDLPSGVINPYLFSYSGADTADRDNGSLKDVKFNEFYICNAKAEAAIDNSGVLRTYTTSLDYVFSLSFYDALRMACAVAGIENVMDIVEAIANPIFTADGKDPITAEELFKDRYLYITYNYTTVMTDFDWTYRIFGDADGDGSVTSGDARAVLRHSVGLDLLRDYYALVYSDVDFDGEITASDAREILRMSVGLEETFTEVPDGKQIKIADTGYDPAEEPVTPPEEEPTSESGEQPFEPPTDPGETEQPTEEETTGKLSPAELAGGTTELIIMIIDSIKDIVGMAEETEPATYPY